MSLSGRLLTVINLIGDIGAVVAAIKFWGENRALSFVAIAAVIAILFLPGVISSIGLILGLGLFAYAVAGNGIVAISTAALITIVMFVLFQRDQRYQQQVEADRQVDAFRKAANEVMTVSREAMRLDPSTPPEFAQPAELQGTKPSPEQPVALPFGSYAPILHRGLTLAAEAMGDTDDEGFRALQIAANRLMYFKPKDPRLADLHHAAANYAVAMFRLCDATATARTAVFTSNDRSQVEALRAKQVHREGEVQAHLVNVQWNIRELYASDGPLFDRLGFSTHELTWLYLDDIVGDLEGRGSEGQSHESQVVSCSDCGTELRADATYCSECGARQLRIPF